MQSVPAAVHEFAADLAALAGPALRSLILHGSLATGDHRPGLSDVDLLLVVTTDLPPEPLVALVRSAGQRIDLHVVSPAAGRYVDAGLGTLVEDPDLVVELSTAREHGIALHGAPPRDVLAPVPPEAVDARAGYWLRRWLHLTTDTEHATFMTLTACRIWLFAVERRHLGKLPSARWALARDPSQQAVTDALSNRPATPSDLTHLLTTVSAELDTQPCRR